jgi:hypothetical protein
MAEVRGLVIPDLLLELLASGRWRPPDGDALSQVMPWFQDPLDFLSSVDQMRWESQSLDLFADDSRSSQLFREARGSVAGRLDLPWLDVELAVLVAVNQRPGDDVAIALDYRTDPADPRVVGSDFWTDPKQCAWRIIAPTLTGFVAALGLLG